MGGVCLFACFTPLLIWLHRRNEWVNASFVPTTFEFFEIYPDQQSVVSLTRKGNSTTTRVPSAGELCTLARPPSNLARSRMLSKPWDFVGTVFGSKPIPQSVISIWTVSFSSDIHPRYLSWQLPNFTARNVRRNVLTQRAHKAIRERLSSDGSRPCSSVRPCGHPAGSIRRKPQ